MSVSLKAAQFLLLMRWGWFRENRFLGRVLDEWIDDSQEFLHTKLPRLIVIAIIAFVLSRLLRLLTFHMTRVAEQSGAGPGRLGEVKTLAGVIRATGLAIIGLIAGLQFLDAMGFNLAPLLASAGVAGIAIGLFKGLDEMLSPLCSCLYWAIAFGGLLFGCLLLERTLDFSKLRLGILLGDASYSIYLAHSLTLNALAVLFQKLLPSASGTALLLILAACGVAGLVSGVACYFWIERPVHHFFRDRIEKNCRVVPTAGLAMENLISPISPRP